MNNDDLISEALLHLLTQEALEDMEEPFFMTDEDGEIILFSYEKNGGALDFFAKNAREAAELCEYSRLSEWPEKQIAYELRRMGL